jgi:chromosome segregation ATPase
MDDDKIQKTIEFILSNQAQFTVEMQHMQESQKDAFKRIGTLEKVSLNLYNTTVEQGKNIAQLTEDVSRVTQDVGQLSKDVKELRASQKETNNRLDAVIVMFEKFLDNQNGAKS